MPLHEHFHIPVTSCQRAEVKRVLHCDATASVDMDVFLSKDFLLLGYFLFNKYKFIFSSPSEAGNDTPLHKTPVLRH